jgi:hypothetical protein
VGLQTSIVYVRLRCKASYVVFMLNVNVQFIHHSDKVSKLISKVNTLTQTRLESLNVKVNCKVFSQT